MFFTFRKDLKNLQDQIKMFYEMNIKDNYSKANPLILNYIISGYRENNIPLSSFNN